MRISQLLLALGLLIALLFAGLRPVFAHGEEPLRTVAARIGPYPVLVHYYSEPRGGQALLFSIEPQGILAGDFEYQVTAVPGTMVNAVPVTATFEPDPNHSGGIQGELYLPVSGQWLLQIDLEGPLGYGSADAPILAGAPPALPAWFGWLVGLIPVWVILGFIVWQGTVAPAREVKAAG